MDHTDHFDFHHLFNVTEYNVTKIIISMKNIFDFVKKNTLILLKQVFERTPIDIEKLLYALSHPAGFYRGKMTISANFGHVHFQKMSIS